MKTTNINQRYGKPIVVDLADTQPERRDLYMGTLVLRIIAEAKKRMKYDGARYQPHARFSWANLARATGIPYWTIVSYFVKRDRPLDIATLDKVLWSMKLSVLDLIEPVEIVSYLQSLDGEDLIPLRTAVKRMLDKLNAQAYSTTSAPDSQIAQTGDDKAH